MREKEKDRERVTFFFCVVSNFLPLVELMVQQMTATKPLSIASIHFI